MLHENSARPVAVKFGDSVVSQMVRTAISLALCFGMAACSNGMLGTSKSSSSSLGRTTNVTVDITPGSPSVVSSGTLQLGAILTNTSNPEVTWFANSGVITRAGLFTAPAVKATQTVIVRASSVASPSATATIAVTVTVPGARLAIATTSIPAGAAGTTYFTTLIGAGGTAPYVWSLASGALPPGLQLSSTTGVISGVATQSGTYVFSVQMVDANGTVATQTFQMTIDSQGGTNCGPPTYPCSRSDSLLITPQAPPQLGSNPSYYGGHTGAGTVAIDPAYNNRILRVTDGNTVASIPGQSYKPGGSAEKNVSSYDESIFLVHNETGGVCVFQYDAASFTTQFHGCFNNVGSSPDFGYTEADQYAFYSYFEQKLYRFVIDPTNWTIAADATFNNGLGYFDPDSANCLNGQIAANHWYTGDSGLSSDDNTMIVAVGPSQDAYPYFVVWNRTKGCQWMNVKTWQVSQGWNTGQINPKSISWASGSAPTQPGGIHNAQIDRGGNFGVLTINQVTSLNHKLFWTIGTNQVDDTCVSCHSHWACDYGICFWNMGPGTGFSLEQQTIGSVDPVLDINTAAVEGQWGSDEHMSHANAVEGQKLIYLVAFQPGGGASSVNQVWSDEILGVNWDGSLRTIRFNKSWDSGYGGFNGAVRCSISRQGNYAICNSDLQMYNLDKGFGSGLNQDTCDHTKSAAMRNTTGCRSDVLLFELR